VAGPPEACGRAAADPWFRDCRRVECTRENGFIVARGVDCVEPTLSLYTGDMKPLESPGGPLAEVLLRGAEWVDGPPHAIESPAVVSVARRSVVLEAEAPPYGRVAVKVLKKPGGGGREEAVLRGLRGSPFAPRLLAVYRVSGHPYMLVYEAVSGSPLASEFVEAALETLWSGPVKTPRCAAPLGRAAAALHASLRRLPGRLSPRQATRRDAEAWISRIEGRASMLPALAPGDGEVAEAAEILRWLAAEWREKGLQRLATGEVQALHGDLHLYQVYAGPACKLTFTDFEGEPLKTPGSPWDLEHRERDLAALKRSVVYAAALAAEMAGGSGMEEAARAALTEPLASWSEESFGRVVEGYTAAWEGLGLPGDEPVDEAKLRFWTLERLSYELVYELAYETGYHHVPLWSLLKNPDAYAPPP